MEREKIQWKSQIFEPYIFKKTDLYQKYNAKKI